MWTCISEIRIANLVSAVHAIPDEVLAAEFGTLYT